jgi:hypothetical protein
VPPGAFPGGHPEDEQRLREHRFAGQEILHPHDHLVPALTIFMILNCSSSMVDWIC